MAQQWGIMSTALMNDINGKTMVRQWDGSCVLNFRETNQNACDNFVTALFFWRPALSFA